MQVSIISKMHNRMFLDYFIVRVCFGNNRFSEHCNFVQQPISYISSFLKYFLRSSLTEIDLKWYFLSEEIAHKREFSHANLKPFLQFICDLHSELMDILSRSSLITFNKHARIIVFTYNLRRLAKLHSSRLAFAYFLVRTF